MPGPLHLASRMASARRRLGLAQDRFIVLHAAGLAPCAGADTVILGLAMLRARWGINADLIVAHADLQRTPAWQPQLARLRTVAADLGIAAQVRFSVPKDHGQMRDYHGAANVLACTPWYARGRGTLAAAMACARPVIGTRVRHIEDLIVDGLTGYLIPPRDSEALAGRLETLQRQPAQAEAMGAAGRQRLRAHSGGRPHPGCGCRQARLLVRDDDHAAAWLSSGFFE